MHLTSLCTEADLYLNKCKMSLAQVLNLMLQKSIQLSSEKFVSHYSFNQALATSIVF